MVVRTVQFRKESVHRLVALPNQAPSLERLRAEGKACAARIDQAERTINVTSRDTLNEWFDQAHRLALARRDHGLRGASFREFASDIGIKGSQAFDIEQLDGHRDVVFTKCEELERQAFAGGQPYRWPGWQAALEIALPHKARTGKPETAKLEKRIVELERELERRPAPDAFQYRRVVTFCNGSEERPTPQHIFDYLNKIHHFDLDVAATKETAKCSRYFSKESDGLKRAWKCEAAYMNPPFTQLDAFCEKAWGEVQRGNAKKVVALLPVWTDTTFFRDYVANGKIILLTGRLRFGEASGTAPFPSMIVIWTRSSARKGPALDVTVQEIRRPH